MRSGAIAQLGERLLCKQEVVGSIPSGSTSRDAVKLGFNALVHVKLFYVSAICGGRMLSDIVKRRSFRKSARRKPGGPALPCRLQPMRRYIPFVTASAVTDFS
jgi:hypothetical protein